MSDKKVNLVLVIVSEDGKNALFVDDKANLTFGSNLKSVTDKEGIERVKEKLGKGKVNIQYFKD